MATLRQLRTRVASIKNIQRVTNAMQLVAAARMRRAQENIMAARPYAQQLDRVLQVRHPTAEQALRLMQGPLADILTHVGQLAMLRRFAGSSVPGENLYVAPIKAGRLGPDENTARRPMDD